MFTKLSVLRHSSFDEKSNAPSRFNLIPQGQFLTSLGFVNGWMGMEGTHQPPLLKGCPVPGFRVKLYHLVRIRYRMAGTIL